MNSGFFAAFAGLVARTDALGLAANNLANISTPGFKAQREFYTLLTSANIRPLLPVNQAINDFAVLGGATLDLSPGNLEPTGNDLDLAIEGPGYFTVQTPAGVRYTRNGSFSLSASGRLVTHTGDPVLGDKGPIEIPGGPVSISADGTISVQGAVAARLSLAELPTGTALTLEGNSYFSAPAGARRDATESRVRQGVLESSNINPALSAVSLIELQRHVGMLQRALAIFNTEFNRIAVEDLPRV